jgi:hypothetical protein
MYVRFREQSIDNFFLWGEARSENLASLGGATTRGGIFDNSMTRSTITLNWSGMYSVIHHANLLLKYVPDIPFGTEAKKNNVLAQAYIMRAFIYYTLTRTWGDLPLVVEPIEGYSADLLHLGRTPQADIFRQIKEDLDNAVRLFPDSDFPAGRNVWSRPAAQALKADVYLWTAKRMGGGAADLNEALNALNEAEKGDLELLDDFASVFDYTNKGNREIIMAVKFTELEAEDANIFREMYPAPYQVPFESIDQETIDAIGTLPPANGGLAWGINTHVREQFSTDDQRRTATYLEVYTQDDAGNKSYHYNIPRKFDGDVSTGIRLFYDDIVLYRYADIILMRAEAKNALGQDPAPEINKIRERAYKTTYDAHVFTNGTKETNDEAILNERLLEFLLEGKYWWDLVRFDKVFDIVPSLKGRQSDRYLLLWPISQETISLEPDVQQNSGW